MSKLEAAIKDKEQFERDVNGLFASLKSKYPTSHFWFLTEKDTDYNKENTLHFQVGAIFNWDELQSS